jgi:hypothetical protein
MVEIRMFFEDDPLEIEVHVRHPFREEALDYARRINALVCGTFGAGVEGDK